jgi:hypothetical protein
MTGGAVSTLNSVQMVKVTMLGLADEVLVIVGQGSPLMRIPGSW